MYFIKYQPLKSRLHSRSITEREALPYLVIFSALTALSGAPVPTTGFNIWDALSTVISIVLAITGILYAYSQNGGRTGYDLIQKYVVLGWVVSFRFILVGVPTMIVVTIVGTSLGLTSYDSHGWFNVAVRAVLEAILYQRIGRHIRDTRKQTSEPSVPGCPPQGVGSPEP